MVSPATYGQPEIWRENYCSFFSKIISAFNSVVFTVRLCYFYYFLFDKRELIFPLKQVFVYWMLCNAEKNVLFEK